MHVVIGVTYGRIFHSGDLVAKLRSVADSCLHTCVCDEPDNNDLINTVSLELQIQIRVRETA